MSLRTCGFASNHIATPIAVTSEMAVTAVVLMMVKNMLLRAGQRATEISREFTIGPSSRGQACLSDRKFSRNLARLASLADVFFGASLQPD